MGLSSEIKNESALTVPLILNIESATDVCSVCISRGEEIIAFQEIGERNEHARVITLLIQDCLREAAIKMEELDAVAISSGPGSYTSLRVGASVAKGICFALDKPLIAVDTLQSLAWASRKAQDEKGALYCPMIDARRMDVYANLFDGEGEPVAEAVAKTIDSDSFSDYFDSEQKIVFCGNGANKCKTALAQSPFAIFSPIVACSSKFLAPIAAQIFSAKKFVDPAYYVPTYLKAPNITMPRKSATKFG